MITIKVEKKNITDWERRSKELPGKTLYIFGRNRNIRKDGTLAGWLETFYPEEGESYDFELAKFRNGKKI